MYLVPSFNQNNFIMKRIFFFPLVLSLFACNSNTEKKVETTAKNTDLIGQNLKGKVQQIEESTVMIDSTGKNKPDSVIGVMMFDEKGYQTQYYSKDSAGTHVSEQVMSHNADGTFAELIVKKNGKQVSKLVTEVKDGKYTGGKNYDSTGKQDGYYTDLKTNEYGQVYSGKQHTMDGKIKSTFDMKYDGANFIGGTSTDSTGKTTYTGVVTLNDKGDASEETTTTLEKDISKTEKFTYKYVLDDKGNWTERTAYNNNGKPTKITKRMITYYK